MKKTIKNLGLILGAASLLMVTVCIGNEKVPVWAADDYIMGDIDSDGKVTLKDAKLSLKSSLGISDEGIKNVLAHDVDNDEKISIKDTKIILQLALGMGSLDEIIQRPEITNPPVATSTPTTGNLTSNTNESFAKAVMTLVNEERAKRNLQTLEWDDALASAAQTRAVEITTSFSHTRPDGSSCFSILAERNILNMGCGENIAMGQMSPQDVMNSWMNSDGHRANILNPEFTKIGVGCVRGSNGAYYWTQLFIIGD